MKEHVIINQDRTIVVPESLKQIGIQYDHNVNTITFDCPRYPDGDESVDMSKMPIYINYMRPNKSMDCSLAENVVVDEADETLMHFDWKITRKETLLHGVLSTLICVKKTDVDGIELYHWNTVLIQKFTVGTGMECEEQVADENPEIISQLLARMEAVDTRTSTEAMQKYADNSMNQYLPEHVELYMANNGQRYVDDYLNRNPLMLDETLTDPTKAAPADTVGVNKTKIGENTEKINTLQGDVLNLKHYVSNMYKSIIWNDIAKAVYTKLAPDIFAIGDEFTSEWTDTVTGTVYSNPLCVNHYENVELENGTIVPGMWLQTHYAQLREVQFSHQRAFLTCPDGLAAGTYYFTIESSWGNNVGAGDVICFTTTIDVPSGGRVSGCYGAPDQSKANWRIYTHSADGKTILETIVPTFKVAGTNLGIQKHNTRNGNLNSTQEMAYGWNRWKTSAIRQYLNSDKPKGEWWTPQDVWDIAPDQLTSIDGYLCGIEKELLEVMLTFKVITYANTVNDGGEADITYDKVILPSLEQMYINPQVTGEGESHAYYKELRGSETKFPWWTDIPELKHYAIENHVLSQHVRLRSANRDHACNTWIVYSSGNVDTSNASYASRFAPLVLIGINPVISAPMDAE